MDPPRDLSQPGDEAEARYGRKLNRNPRVRNSCSALFVILVEVEGPPDAASRFLYRPSLNSRKEPTAGLAKPPGLPPHPGAGARSRSVPCRTRTLAAIGQN